MTTQTQPETFKPNSPTVGAKPPPPLPSTKTTVEAPAMKSAPALEIPIASIDESSTNPRKRFPSEEDLRALGESIKTHGLLQPILVRTHPTKKDRFELVFGACRLRAAKLVGLTTIAARCRELSDVEVLEIQIVENNKRADVHPLEEAEAYEQLRTKYLYDVDKIAEKINKSRSHVYQRIKLLALSPEARDAVYAERIPTSCGLYVARIPSKKHQAEAIKMIERGQYNDGATMSARQAQDFITRKYMLKMIDAPFDTKDATLDPAGVACTTCPRRTKNAKDLFPDVKTDMCTDPECFAMKREAHCKRLEDAAKQEGRPVLKAKISREGWDYGTSEYLSLDMQCQNDPKQRTYRELLKGAKAEIAVARDPRGEIVEAVRRADANAFMATKFAFAKERAKENKRDEREDRKFEESQSIGRKARELAIAEAVKLTERRQPKLGFFVAIIRAFEWQMQEILLAALARRGLGEDVGEALASVKDEATLRGIIAELICEEPSRIDADGRAALFAAYDIKQDSFVKAAKAELAKEKKKAAAQDDDGPDTSGMPAKDARAVEKAKKQLAKKGGKK